jgi:cytosine/adenosine deaminase-related metal-dependent hydrolase
MGARIPMDNEVMVSGHALLDETLEERPVTIVVKSGIITHIEDDPHPPDNWICPAFFNAHTHLGDTIAMDITPGGDLVSMVTPPDGLKHRILAQTSYSDLVSGMRSSMYLMTRSGTAGCADFREGGKEGVRALREAAGQAVPGLVIFGREGGEDTADGIGISSIRDVTGLEAQVACAREMGKLVAFHAGEKDPNDVDAALSFDPDLLIHCTHATRDQMRECADRAIPIAICPRSNWAFGVTRSPEKPPVHDLIELGCRFLIGTDNVMVVQPDMFAEMAFMSYVYKTPSLLLLQAAIQGSDLLKKNFFISKGSPARFFVLDPGRSNMRFSRDPCTTLVKRGSSTEIVKKVFIS